MKITVQHGNALTFQADVLAVKYAQHLYGVDLAVYEHFAKHGNDIYHIHPLPFEHQFISSQGILGVQELLVIGSPPLTEFTIDDIQAFSRYVLRTLAEESPTTRHLCLTLHGIGIGLNEITVLQAEIEGIIDAIQQGDIPKHLARISIIELDTERTVRLQAFLPQILPEEFQDLSDKKTHKTAFTHLAEMTEPLLEGPCTMVTDHLTSAIGLVRHLLSIAPRITKRTQPNSAEDFQEERHHLNSLSEIFDGLYRNLCALEREHTPAAIFSMLLPWLATLTEYVPSPSWRCTQLDQRWRFAIRELIELGVNDPIQLVFLVRRLQFINGQSIEGDFLGAIKHVAAELNKPFEEFARTCISQNGTISLVETTLQNVSTCMQMLKRLPIGTEWKSSFNDVPEQIVDAFFIIATQIGGRIMLPLEIAPGWKSLLEQLLSQGCSELGGLVSLVSDVAVELTSSQVIDPVCLNDACDSVAAVTGASSNTVLRAWLDGLKFDRCDDEQLSEYAKKLENLSEVKSVRDLRQVLYHSYRKRHVHLDPPWHALPITAGSMGWRMGGGEDYMTEWCEFWEHLTTTQQAIYFEYHRVPQDWKNWTKVNNLIVVSL